MDVTLNVNGKNKYDMQPRMLDFSQVVEIKRQIPKENFR